MDLIGDRVVWFVLGLLAGWLSGWLMFGRRRGKAPVARIDPGLGSAATMAPTVADAQAIGEHTASTWSPRLIDVAAARAAGFNMKHADDLTVIEGIGPKTVELLRAQGIDSFAKVAQLNVDDMLDILERGGPSFRLANPDSWAQQASLAVENRWRELKRLQDELAGSAGPPAQ
jgi:predicted flap endonuclease-1-like 5' DNA nuclease